MLVLLLGTMTMGEKLLRCGFVVILVFCLQNRLESAFQATLGSIRAVITNKGRLADGLK